MSKIILFSTLYAMFNVLGATIIKHKLLTNKLIGVYDFIVFFFDLRIVGAVFFMFVSMFFAIKALSLSSFSSIIPITIAINFIITVAVGVLFFNDRLSIPSTMGIVFILIGVVLVARG